MVSGIDGVLQALLAEPATSTGRCEELAVETGRLKRKPQTRTHQRKGSQLDEIHAEARRGRPPASSASVSTKQKVTIRIRSELIDTYRDWSWEVRSSLSQLIERALVEYLEHRWK